MYSIVTYTGNGATRLYSITFPYIQQSDVEVYVVGVLKTLTTDYVFTTSSSITFTVAPANGAEVKIKRNTNKSTALVNFTDGSILSADNLDLSAAQMLYVTQELYDSSQTNVEGTWTPVDSSGLGLALTNVSGTYTKIGNYIILNGRFTVPATGSSTPIKIGNIPFPPATLVTASIPFYTTGTITTTTIASPATWGTVGNTTVNMIVTYLTA